MTEMKPFKTLLPRREALRIIKRNVRRIDRKEEVTIHEAMGRVLAEDAIAGFSVPPFDRSSMDGYAVKAEDTYGASTSNPKKLKLIGVQHAGEAFDKVLDNGECIQIATGSPVPEGSNAVVMVEFTRCDEEIIEIKKPAYPGANISPVGEDIVKGEVVIRAGDVLSPSKVGALAALNIERVRVLARPRVAIYSTGVEIKPLGSELAPGQIYDVNSHTLASIVAANDCEPVMGGIISDDMEIIKGAVLEASEFDIGVFSGGSSVGAKDLFAYAVESLGKVLFHGLQVKPGKPTLFGIVEGTPIFGMPGYPTSCLSNAYIFLTPALRGLAGLPKAQPRRIRAKMGQRFVSSSGREQFLTVRIDGDVAIPAFKKSGAITSMAHADGYVVLPVNLDVIEEGAEIEVILLG